MAIPDSFLQELLARADVVEIVGRHVQLKKTGANFSGLCPFHAEKSPSFTVSPTKQFYHCFGCGKHGNAIGFLMEHAGMGFVDAVKDLAGQYGLQVPEDERSPQDRERAAQQRARQQTLADVLEKAGEAYRKHLKNSPRAVAYLKGRGLSGAVAKQFGLGYAPEGWRSLASVFAQYDDPLLVEAGLVITGEDGEDKRYDRFRDRIMFPIRNVKGECIGFGGRVLGDEKPKYLNSPETPVFSKGRELYGLYEARQALREQGYVLVTEGYMDVVALAQLGFPNAVATLGTACTTDHVQKLFRFTDSVVFSFDGDAAGRRAARRALEAALPYATDVRTVRFLFLPPEHDPDSYIREFGREAFARCVGEAAPLSRFLVDSAGEGCDQATAEGRARLAANAKPLWSGLPDGALKRQLLAEIAEQVQLDAQELSSLWSGRPARRAASRPAASPSPPAARRGRPGRALPASRADHAARLLLGHSAAWEQLTQEDHVLLCSLPAPHGELLGWLESQVLEHGPLPWGSLREALQGQPAAELAERLMNESPAAAAPLSEATAELRDLLDRMLVERLKAQETTAIEAGNLELYRQLHSRRRELETTL
ncbi:DNA primase [Ramlibacter tataouinensis]|uniref:DNA primase n=1 Tax=Ramlibacter tataouinensis (strain ATCC BAA-407 / DSM 14655 / LMG 21543 / TTB310) TaxID=365046 RepID=F5Y1Y4_RAMTT|nr:DNA primase [Ramlibacter tataouinensis]AEG93568.1 Candidate DNA primase protein DnaG [Ramlibacter tataouinensis TTB310]